MRFAWRQLPLILWKGNGAAAPTLAQPIQRIWRGSVNTVAGGTATFQVTTTGLVGGTALFTDLVNSTIQATARANVSAAWQVQYCMVKSVDAKTIVVNVVGNGSFAGAGIQVDLVVIGV